MRRKIDAPNELPHRLGAAISGIHDKYFFIFEWRKFVHLLEHDNWQITKVNLLESFSNT